MGWGGEAELVLWLHLFLPDLYAFEPEHGTSIKCVLAFAVPELRNPFPCCFQRGYDDLQTIVPTCQQQDFSIGSQKLSKAIVLQKSMSKGDGDREGRSSGWEVARTWSHPGVLAVMEKLVFWLSLPQCPTPLLAPTPAIDYIQFLHKEKKKQEEEVSTLRKDVTALKIMKV